MFKIHDSVLYGSMGVCRIVDIRPQVFNRKEILYYVLKPENDESSTFYCPVDSDKVRLRKLLSREEVYDLIRVMPDTDTEWIEDDQARQEKFLSILKNGSRRDLVRLIKTIYQHRNLRTLEGKKLHMADKKIMQDAESLLYGEIAHVLKIDREDVLAFIMGELEGKEKNG